MSRAVLAVLALALAACVRPSPESARPSAEDECFAGRDAARNDATRRGTAGALERFRALDARCEKRAALLLDQAVTLRAENPDRALVLAERAIVLASRNGDALERAKDLREVLQLDGERYAAGEDPPADEVAGHLADAEQYERAGDWAGVREALRSALSVKANDAIQERLREVEARCRLEARRALGEARAYEAAEHVDAAYEAIDRVLSLADPDSAEADEAHDIQERLDDASNAMASGERDTGVGDLPGDPRPEPLDGSQVARMERAREAEAKDDWLTARYLWRQLAEEYASDPGIEPARERAENRCLLIARRLIIEAKAYAAASNYGEADKLLQDALRYADGVGPEHDEAGRLAEQLRREGSPAPPTYDVPPADASLAALLRAGDVSVKRQDWLAAREIYRRALSTNPGDESVVAMLESAHAECIRIARRQISEAKAYEAAYNYPEALKSLQVALLYADRPTDRENEQAKKIEERIRYASNRP